MRDINDFFEGESNSAHLFNGMLKVTPTEDAKRIAIEYAEQFMIKAEKWDELDNQLAEVYSEGDDDNEQETDLCDIGEMAATAFGYL